MSRKSYGLIMFCKGGSRIRVGSFGGDGEPERLRISVDGPERFGDLHPGHVAGLRDYLDAWLEQRAQREAPEVETPEATKAE